MEQDFDFDTWFDLMMDKCRSLGYNGTIDKYTFEWNWEEGETPEKAAEDFVKEMNEQAYYLQRAAAKKSGGILPTKLNTMEKLIIDNYSKSTLYRERFEGNLRRRTKLAVFYGEDSVALANEFRYLLELKGKKI